MCFVFIDAYAGTPDPARDRGDGIAPVHIIWEERRGDAGCLVPKPPSPREGNREAVEGVNCFHPGNTKNYEEPQKQKQEPPREGKLLLLIY